MAIIIGIGNYIGKGNISRSKESLYSNIITEDGLNILTEFGSLILLE